MTTAYELAKEAYAQYGIDTEAVIEKLAAKPVSMHCWQGDDVMGFDQKDNAASGGIIDHRVIILGALAPSRSSRQTSRRRRA